MEQIVIKRIYEEASNTDGYRLLIDRIWPRGISKEKAKLNEWNKNIAPSAELRKWFDHKEERFEIFSSKYKDELLKNKSELLRIKTITEKQRISLLYGAKNKKYNQAIVLKEVLDNL